MQPVGGSRLRFGMSTKNPVGQPSKRQPHGERAGITPHPSAPAHELVSNGNRAWQLGQTHTP